jgi:hypothetical protein
MPPRPLPVCPPPPACVYPVYPPPLPNPNICVAMLNDEDTEDNAHEVDSTIDEEDEGEDYVEHASFKTYDVVELRDGTGEKIG